MVALCIYDQKHVDIEIVSVDRINSLRRRGKRNILIHMRKRKRTVGKGWRRHLLMGYGALIIIGFGIGRIALANPQDETERPETPQEKTLDKVKNTIEKIREDADAGPEEGEGSEAAVPSPEPETDGGLPDYRVLPEKDAKGGEDKTVIIIEITEIIDKGLSAFVARTIEENHDAAALILDINTPGGRVDAATEIRDAIIDAPKSMRTVAFIHPRAISAGAFISFACDLIFIADGGSMGAATPITISGGGAEPVEEKYVSYFRTEMATTARAKGRRGDIAEAMVDAEIEIEGISQAGKLLTLDTAGALKWEIADAKANSLDEVLELLALGGAKREHEKLNWAEEVARVLTHPILSGILMSIGVLGILIELYQPGFGLPGILGISCLIIFFTGHLIVNLAGWEEVLLFVVGVGLLGVEIFVTPGFGILGILGVLAIFTSLVLALISMPLDVSFDTGALVGAFGRVIVSLFAAVLLFVAALAILPKTRIGGKLVLREAIAATASGGREGAVIEAVLASGVSGVAESFLRPAGIARFGDKRVDVVSEGEFIEKGEKVVIVRTHGNRVTVKKEA